MSEDWALVNLHITLQLAAMLITYEQEECRYLRYVHMHMHVMFIAKSLVRGDPRPLSRSSQQSHRHRHVMIQRGQNKEHGDGTLPHCVLLK